MEDHPWIIAEELDRTYGKVWREVDAMKTKQLAYEEARRLDEDPLTTYHGPLVVMRRPTPYNDG